MSKIVWTEIDEAPALATYSLLPIVQGFTNDADIEVVTSDISLSGRVLANFPEKLTEDQKVADNLKKLGDWTQDPEANIIKLPNISASVPQLQACIKELQEKGYDVPNYPEEPKNDAEKALQERYSKCLGSAVNPVLREGNSDRRAAAAVKKNAQKNLHRMMKAWPEKSECRVAHMESGDFYATEQSVTLDKADTVKYEFVDNNGKVTTLKEGLKLLAGEVLGSSTMKVAELRKFYTQINKEAKEKKVLLSLHLKATMMKVSDPVMFGHAVSVYFADALDKYEAELKEIGASVDFGLGDVLSKLDRLPADKKAQIEADINACYEKNASLAMV